MSPAHSPSNQVPPPGARSLPVLGSLHRLRGTDPLHVMLTPIVRQHGDVASMHLGSGKADAGAAALVQELLSPSALDLTFRTFFGSVETETGEPASAGG